ncbi:hypothetical protein TRFO_35981 [Tritrichomonas foetus]|uniref:Uncharacterized protein n=1 Tax=Tritrichomonas foetus TaxID=1144522 RepID=A0A1J4JGE6_9EUKA|nr:hypothetical protein TRFO_35981 [Tritrichomonas foetus]|eukprot:OHS97737.1 hypothetical protein TRFO_35981 [Tritrichomonas foetus]
MAFEALSPEWCLKVQETLAQIRRDISNKADRSLVEQIKRQEIEKKRVFTKAKLSNSLDVGINESTFKVCDEMVEKGDLDTAFLSVLRYIETISNTKADSEEIYEKATREYVEKIFTQLNAMNREQMMQKSEILHQTIEERINEISSRFDQFSTGIEQRLVNCTNNLAYLDEQITSMSGLIQIRQTSQVSKSKLKKESNEGGMEFTARKKKKPKNSGIVIPTHYKPKPEPTAKDLCLSITVTSEQKKTRSLLVTD